MHAMKKRTTGKTYSEGVPLLLAGVEEVGVAGGAVRGLLLQDDRRILEQILLFLAIRSELGSVPVLREGLQIRNDGWRATLRDAQIKKKKFVK